MSSMWIVKKSGNCFENHNYIAERGTENTFKMRLDRHRRERGDGRHNSNQKATAKE